MQPMRSNSQSNTFSHRLRNSMQRNGMECVYFLQTIFARHPKQGSTGKESRERAREAIEANLSSSVCRTDTRLSAQHHRPFNAKQSPVHAQSVMVSCNGSPSFPSFPANTPCRALPDQTMPDQTCHTCLLFDTATQSHYHTAIPGGGGRPRRGVGRL